MAESHHVLPPPPEGKRGPVMFLLSAVYLLILGLVLHRHDRFDPDKLELRAELAVLAALWPVFIVEAVWRFFQRDPGLGFWKPLGHTLLFWLIPPTRMAARSVGPGRQVWLPGLGWQPVDKELREKLERVFSIPMIGIALLVVPVLAVEYFWPRTAAKYEWLALALSIASAVIWFAFAIEFLVLFSVAHNKLRFCVNEWATLLVVFLPMIGFLPVLRVLRLGRLLRLSKLTRMGKFYRLWGVLQKAWHGFLLLEVVRILLGQSLGQRLNNLEKLKTAKEEELADLQREIDELRERVAREKAEKGEQPEEDREAAESRG